MYENDMQQWFKLYLSSEIILRTPDVPAACHSLDSIHLFFQV